MEIEKQIEEVLRTFPDSKQCSEGGFNFIYFPEIELPSGCLPEKVEALLCYHTRDGYESRLFLSSEVTNCPRRNWNAKNVRILDKNWFGVSWRTAPGLTIQEMLFTHIKAFENG